MPQCVYNTISTMVPQPFITKAAGWRQFIAEKCKDGWNTGIGAGMAQLLIFYLDCAKTKQSCGYFFKGSCLVQKDAAVNLSADLILF